MGTEPEDVITVPNGPAAPDPPRPVDTVETGETAATASRASTPAAPATDRAVPLPARRTTPVAVAVAAGAVLVLAVLAGLTWPGWAAMRSRLAGAVAHHPDTVIATVLLAGSLATIWRLSDRTR